MKDTGRFMTKPTTKEMLKMNRLGLLLMLFLAGCNEPAAAGYECDMGWRGDCPRKEYWFKWQCDTISQSKFIISCAEAANPKSDEEGEDLVRQCEKTSQNLFCEKKFYGGSK